MDRSEKYTNRRTVLASISTGAIGVGSLQTAAAADSIREPTIDDALQSEEVQLLRATLEIAQVRPGDAFVSTVELSGDGGRSLYASTVDIPIGGSREPLRYAELHDGTTPGTAEAFLDPAAVDQPRSRRHRLPRGAAGHVVSNGSDVLLVRGVTRREGQWLGHVLDRDPETIVAGTNSALEGYTVRASTDEPLQVDGSPTSEALVVPESDREQSRGDRIEAGTDRSTRSATVSSIENDDSTSDQFVTRCGDCARSIAMAGDCDAVCGGVTATTAFMGLLPCLVCGQESAALSGRSCTNCLEYVHHTA